MYNATSLSPGPILLPHLMRAILTKRLTFRGFIVSDFSARHGDFMRDVSAWVREGRIKYREAVVEGLRTPTGPHRPLARGEFRQTLGARCTLSPNKKSFISGYRPVRDRPDGGHL